ncbi:RagB/SusD family nutrient uptake outer membrane protein [Bacteroides sp.]|uniref:RagB/SusD family nutrient uptake outer membrane protein n=1 Tax=Bacteroides sp. TaxID=29523 RepID=UPI002FCA4CB3
MKLKYMIACTLGLITGISSCTLDYNPVSDFSDVTMGEKDDSGATNPFKNREEMFTQYTALYNRMRDNQEHWYLDALLLGDAHADNAYGGTTGAEVVPFETNSIDGGNSVIDRDWSRYLTDIATANKIIFYIDGVPDPTFAQSERNRWKAEAKIYRGMILFDMTRIWGSIPVITTIAGDITSDNIEEVYPSYFPKQNTQAEVYAQIEKDLTEALADAPNNNPADKTRLSKTVARALLAKVYAEKTLRDYAKVITYCDQVLADGISLEKEYDTLFGMNATNTDCKARNTSESILELQYPAGNGNWVNWMFGRNLANWEESFTWAKWVTPSRDLIKAYEDEGDQVRYEQSIVYYECKWSNYYPANHYPFMYKCRSSYSNIIKLRLADILLLKAEALILKESPDLSGAASILNQIRNRAKLKPLSATVTSSKEAMITALLKERRLELAFEGQRWFDLCRLDKVESVMNSVYRKDSGRKAQAYAFDSNSYLLPLPQSAIDQNENLVQNPGY